jgi:hypothetical protein
MIEDVLVEGRGSNVGPTECLRRHRHLFVSLVYIWS